MIMSILLAVGDKTYTDLLRKIFVEQGLEVSDNEVLHRNYLNEIIDEENPSIVVIHDAYLPSDYSNQAEVDDEILKFIAYWRNTYDDSIRIVYLCERERRDPFLAKLVAYNVLDIFNQRQIQTNVFVEQIKQPPRFSNVSKFGIGELEVQYEEEPAESETEESNGDEDTIPNVLESPTNQTIANNLNKAQNLVSDLSGKAKSLLDAGKDWNEQRLSEKESKVKDKAEAGSDSGVNGMEYLDIMPIPKEIYGRTQVLGTIAIAVAGVRPHLGATHTAMSIARYLQSKKNSVALIELNESEDFERIHALYEGEKQYLRHQSYFNLYGIDHYKFRKDFRLGEIMATYEYVVLDFGHLHDEHTYYEEFLRSHIQAVLVSPFEWKQVWTDEFREEIGPDEHFFYVIPCADENNMEDMMERIPDIEIVPFPPSVDPYKMTDGKRSSIEFIMQGYIKEGGRTFSKKTIIAASVISAVVTTGIISAFALL